MISGRNGDKGIEMIKILYTSCLCSQKMLQQLFLQYGDIGLQIQKFHRLLAQGLAENEGTSVETLSSIPVNRVISNKTFWRIPSEKENKISYNYLPFINYFLIRQATLFLSSFFLTLVWLIKNAKEHKVIICDVLNLSTATGSLLAGRILNILTVAVVTDIPGFLRFQVGASQKLNTFERLCMFFMRRYSSYVLLADQMTDLIKPKDKPYTVVEGFVDIGMAGIVNRIDDRFEDKIIIYAGALYERYGVKKLIEAFMGLSTPNARIWIYGSGEMEDAIRLFEKQDDRIKYFGVVANEDIVKAEMKAWLLVNPRPSDEEFTKYSFPSKNMEYMVSGTPVLTTPLPSMPTEYYDYVYTIDDETVEGLTTALSSILSKTKEELHQKGKEAKDFVLKEKNNMVQARKILAMIGAK